MNILPNGTVLPSGLLGLQGHETNIVAFNHSYRNTGIKAGLVTNSYAASDPNNKNGLCTEYDVLVMEQFENKGTTSLLYRNCMSSQGFGSVADFLEYTLRPKTTQSGTGFPTFNDQDGAIVLIQCLDNVGDKAIVIGSLINPKRTTTISGIAPQLSGEYNGVNVQIQNDGSCSLTFKGATDNTGASISSPGNTELQIEADGSFQFNHSTITIRADKSGVLTINAKSDANITVGGNSNVNVSGDTNLTTTGKTIIKSKEIDLNIDSPQPFNGITTSQSHENVIDLITGVECRPSMTVFGDV